MPWGDWASSSQPAQPQLGSSLGSQPAQPSGGGGWGSWANTPPPSAGGGGGGQSNWWGSLTDPLGLVSAAKQFGSGIATGFGDILVGAGKGIGDTLAAATGRTDWGTAKTDWGNAVQGVGDMGVGMLTGVENLTATAALPLGGENGATQWLKDRFAGFNKYVAAEGILGSGTSNPMLSPQFAAQLDNGGAGMQPTDWLQAARTQGIGAATVQTVGQAAMVAGAAAGVSGAMAGSAEAAASQAEAAGAIEDAAKFSARAESLKNMTNVLNDVAHPYKFVGRNTADLLAAMREAAFPAEVTPPMEPGAAPDLAASAEPGATDAQVAAHESATVPQEVLVAARDAQHPATAAADAMTQGNDTAYSASTELQNALADAIAAMPEAKPAEFKTAPEPGFTRLYNGGQNNDTMWTTDLSRAESYRNAGIGENAGKVRYIDVPNAEADQLKTTEGTAAHGAAMAAGNQPNTATDYYLAARQDLVGKAGEVPAPKAEGAPIAEATAAEKQPVFREAPKVEPQVEPRKYDTSAGQPVTPEEKAIRDQQLRSDTAAARDNVDPPLYVYDQLGRRLAMPTPQWAKDIAENLPDSVNRMLGRLGANFVDQVRYRNLFRNLQQAMETAQNVARSSPAMRLAEDAARQILGPTVGRDKASAMIGEEIHARLAGRALLAEWAKAHDGFSANTAQAAKLDEAAHVGYKGIDDKTWQSLTPQDRVKLQQTLNQATEAFKGEAAKTLETIMASRYGAKGLEKALLNPDEVPMTPEQLRMYRRAERDLLYSEKAKERAPLERERTIARAERAQAMGERAHNLTDDLRRRLRTTLATVQDLYKGVPKGMENDGTATIGVAMRTLATEGGALVDVATGQALHPTEGIYVPLSQQFDVSAQEFAANGQQLVHDAIFQPKATDGQVYDVQALWGGLDARLALNMTPDGRVVGTIGQATLAGKPMAPWQAYLLGSAHESPLGLDFSTNKQLALATDPSEQALAMHYAADVRDPNSGLSRWASERAALAADPNLNITPSQFNNEMMANLWLDKTMTDLRGNGWKHGDIFNTELAMGKGEPTLGYLAQTIMEDLTVPEHVDRAMTAADAESVNNMLAWYYKSHDFIESAYRGKTVPITGRDAAETFYDLIALTSVMASPTQNLGRALAGMANLEDFLNAHTKAFTDAKSVMDEVMGNKPQGVVYVKNLGVTRESYLSENPRTLGETPAQVEKRVAANIEKTVPKGQGGTPISQRWLESPAARDLSAQTSMTTSPKYRIIDALLGKFNLQSATAEDIGGQPEWWTGNATEFSDAKLSPDAVMHHAQLLGITGPELDAYKQWAAKHEEIVAARQVREAAGKNYVQPITDAQNVEAKASDTAGQLGDNREVSAHEYQTLADNGRAYVEQRLANSSPHVLADPALRKAAFDSVQEDWGGATVDSHTGKAIPAEYHGDSYAVTARLPGMKEVNVPIGSSEAVFNKAYDRALKMYAPVLNGQDGHLGVFNNPTTGRIEIDPVYHTMNPQDTEAVGAYTHAVGGAYHFRSGNGYWIPHVKDHEAFASKASMAGAVKASAAEGQALAKGATLRPAYENALMEYHGSALLAKLRSFRDNLAHPHESLAVTLDSIMAQLFGFDKTHWGVKGEYARYADMVRESANQWSQIAGRPVMPHEVQALLWVYAKRFIGTQDWGRWLAHQDNAHQVINTLEAAVKSGKTINVKNFDPLGPLWKEELQFSRDQLAVRTERAPLRKLRTAGALTPEQAQRLDYLEKVPTRQSTEAQVMGPDGQVHTEVRNETSYDAKVLANKENQYVDYLTSVVAPMRKAIEAGDFNKARSILDEYVTGRKKAILGVVEGAEFGPKMLADPKSVGAQSIARLRYAKHVPGPNPDAVNTSELYSSFGDKVRGVTMENPNKLGRIMMRLYHTADISTLLHEDLHAFRLHAPGNDVAVLSDTYPHIQDATMTPERRAAEEQFVSDFQGYLYDRAYNTNLPPQMQARVQPRVTGPLAVLFNDVANTLQQTYGPALMSEAGKAVPNSITNYWDSIFNHDIQKPNVVDDPLRAQYQPTTKGVNPTQARGESDFQFVQRLRQYGEARGQAQILEQRVRDRAAMAARADKFANDMAAQVLEPTKSEIIAAKLEGRATATLQKLSDQIENATGNKVPRGWRPFMDALDSIRAEAAKDLSLQPLLDEIPQNFAAAMRFAAERGFEPTYMPELTHDMAQKYLYNHIQLNTSGGEAGLRKENLGVLKRANVVDHTLESLGAGNVMAMQELLQSKLLQFTEENYARQWQTGVGIPDGWKPWNSTRDAIITGRNLDGKEVAVNADKIIPEAVYKTLQSLQRQPVDLPFRFLWKGAPMTVWKNLLLTYSPTWYIKHFVGAVGLATVEGVRLQDWVTAYRQWKTDTLPDVARGRTIYNAIDELTGRQGSIIPRNKIKDLPDLVRSEGYKIAANEVNAKFKNSVKVVDSLSRAAVYAKTIRTTGDAARAAYRAYEAIGDFGRLGPIERSLVTQIVPFYAFQKAMLRILIHFPSDHPVAFGLFMQLGAMNQAYLQQQLHGPIPDAYNGSTFINGRLTPVDKLSPLSDAWKMATPEGIAASTNPFIRLLAQDALGAPTYGGQPAMDANGNLVSKPNLWDTIVGTYTGAVPGVGRPLGPDSLAVASALSDAQYQKLVKRIAKVQTAQNTVASGGYLVTDAYKPKQAASSGGGSGGWGSWGSSGTKGTAAKQSGNVVRTPRVPKVRAPRIRWSTRSRGLRRTSFTSSLGRSHHKR